MSADGFEDLGRARFKYLRILSILLALVTATCINTRASEEPADGGAAMEALLAGLEDDPLNPDARRLSITGHYKNLFQYATTDRFLDGNTTDDQTHTLIADLNRLRLSPEYKHGDRLMVHADIDVDMIISGYTGTRTFTAWWQPCQFNDLADLTYEDEPAGDLFARLNLHRLYTKISTGQFTLTLGRQLIRFGSGRLWNPLDILNPITPTLMEGAEDQKGTDAFRVEYYPAASTEIALVYAPKRKYNDVDSHILANRNTNIISRIKTSIGEADLAVLGGRVARRSLFGADLAAIVKDGMLRASLLVSFPDERSHFIQSGTGYEYNFANGLYCLVEYFYNQIALNSNNTLAHAYEQAAVFGMNEERYTHLANQFLTVNRHYAGLALGYDLTPLLRSELFIIGDLEGRGLFLSPSLHYNLFQNLDLTAAAMAGTIFNGAGKDSDFTEFEDHPLIYMSVKWYF